MWDEEIKIRNIAVEKILKVRETSVNNKIRYFKEPKLNFDAKKYYDVIDWEHVEITEPPILRNYSASDLWDMANYYNDSSVIYTSESRKLPCHNQAVERCIKVVTEASLTVCSPDSRDGLIRNKLKSRNIMPKFLTKSQFKTV